MSIPPDMKVKKHIYTKVLRKAFPIAMKMPRTRKSTVLTVFKHPLARIVKSILTNHKLIKVFERLNRRLSKHIESMLLGSRILALPPKKEDLSYLENLIRDLELPPFINKAYLFKEIAAHKRERRDCSYFLVPIASFCTWYNLFCKDHPDRPEDIKTRVKQHARPVYTETIDQNA